MYLQLSKLVYMFIFLYCATWCIVLRQRRNCEKIFSRMFTFFPIRCHSTIVLHESLINWIIKYRYNVPKDSLTPFFFAWVYWYIKANSHIPCRAVPCCAHAMFRQCRVLREIPRGSRKNLNSLLQQFNGSSFEFCCYHSYSRQHG